MRKQYHKRTTLRSERGTIKGLLYAHDPEKCEKGMLSDLPRLSRITSTALLCRGGQKLLEDMTSFGTNFEARHMAGERCGTRSKDFIARNARTIALSTKCEEPDNQPYQRVWKSLGDSIPELYCVA
jgi:hypothetical protein